MTDTNKQIDEILAIFANYDDSYEPGYEDVVLARIAEAKAKLHDLMVRERINSLLDLELWIKLHDLDTEMILDGIEHMCKSNLQVPNQPRINHDDRIKSLEATLNEKGKTDD